MELSKRAKVVERKPVAVVIHDTQGKKAEVVSHPTQATVVEKHQGSIEALRIIKAYRESAHIEPMSGFNGAQLELMARAYRLAPIRFVYESRGRDTDGGGAGHWMLFVGNKPDGEISVYDPTQGIKDFTMGDEHKFYTVEFNDPLIEARFSPAVKLRGGVMQQTILNAPPEAAYQLDATRIADLGILQATPADCGPLSVYAGMIAKGLVPSDI